MQRLLIYILIICTAFSSCTKKTDNLFSETADQRIQKKIDSFKNTIVTAPGWKLFVYPKGLERQDIEVGGLTYYVRFNDAGRVNMISDFTDDMASIAKESSYSIRAYQRISLVFDTYSYIHVAADPDETVSFSPTGNGGFGWGTDFDFSFTEEGPHEDTINLKGNFNGSDAFLIRATEEEMNEAFAGRVQQILENTRDFTETNSFLYFPASDNSKVGFSLNLFLYTVNFSYLDGGNLVHISAPFSHTTYGLHFKQPITVGSYTFQDIYWDDALQLYYIDTGTGRVNIISSSVPLFPFVAVLGRSISTISVPVTPLPGQSATFATVYAQVKTNLKTGGYNLDLDVMDFIFDDKSKSMALQIDVTRDGVTFIVQYVYSYTINGSGIAAFTLQQLNPNGQAVEGQVKPLLDYLANDIFKLDYFTGGGSVLGQFISQDSPDFFFTGNLR